MELRKFVAPEFIFGPGAMQLVGRYLKNFGAQHALVINEAKARALGVKTFAMKPLVRISIARIVRSALDG